MWQAFIKEEWTSPQRSDYFFAMIAAEICKGNVKNPNGIKLSDFLLKFGNQEEKSQPLTEEQKTAYLAMSKARWGAAVGTKISK
jgi:hypothetical protein